MFHITFESARREAEALTITENWCFSVVFSNSLGYVVYTGWDERALYCTIIRQKRGK